MDEADCVELDRVKGQLKEKILRHSIDTGKNYSTVDGLLLISKENNDMVVPYINSPTVTVVLQGHSWTKVGSEVFHYGEVQWNIAALYMPSIYYHPIDASPENPFLAVAMEFDRYLVAQHATEIWPAQEPPANDYSFTEGVISPVEAGVLDAFLRLVDLLDHPEQIPLLAPIIKKELYYRWLLGPQGEWLRTKINTYSTQNYQIAQAINWLQENYREPLLVDNLAEKVNMAPSTFHRHFKLATSLSPIQFQKKLRLYEAQRLMLVEARDVNNAAVDVGYESASQFNREYKRLFGEPPYRDISRLRENMKKP